MWWPCGPTAASATLSSPALKVSIYDHARVSAYETYMFLSLEGNCDMRFAGRGTVEGIVTQTFGPGVSSGRKDGEREDGGVGMRRLLSLLRWWRASGS